jgi:hypothetical protein
VFDIDKTTAMAAYITKRRGSKISVFVLIKMMYAAEREALSGWHRSISGDNFTSMRKGPVLSRVYDLIKGDVSITNSDMIKWSQFMSPRIGNEVRLLAEPELDYLSQREVDAIDRAIKSISSLIEKHGLIADVLHQAWPEWRDPGNSSFPIALSEVLNEVMEDEMEVSRVAAEIQSVNSAKAALQIRI